MGSPLFPNSNRRRSAEAAQNAQRAGEPTRYGLGSSIRRKIVNAVTAKIGSIGDIVNALLRPFGKSVQQDVEEELRNQQEIQDILSRAEVVPARPQIQIGGAPPIPPDDWREFPHDEGSIIEGPIRVQSSNVYQIAFAHSLNYGQKDGDLYVTFLGVGADGKTRTGEGPTYVYRGVGADIWSRFKQASSPGGFVWENLRVLGTVSGHQYDYHLTDLGNLTRVPRQAGLKRHGIAGEHFMPRNFRGQRSTLPEQKVRRGSRTTIRGYKDPSDLRFR